MAKNSRYETFQKALVDARLNVNLTQTEVSLRIGKHQSFVSKYESGERRLDVIEFLDVCEALDLKPAAILRKLGSNND